MMKLVNKINKILSLIPILWLLIFWSFVVRTRVFLGYWPRPYDPDPKFLGFAYHHMSIYFLFIGILILFVPTFYFLLLETKKLNSITFYKKLYPVSIITIVLMIYFDPGSYLYWFLD